MQKRIAIVFLCCAQFTGCATKALSGTTLADDKLAGNILNQIKQSFYASTKGGCSVVESVDRQLVSTKKDHLGRITLIKEKWHAKGCDKAVAYNLYLIPDQQGGTFFTLSY